MLKEIDDLVSGRGKKKGVLVVFKNNCPEGTYRYGEHGEKIVTAAELEQIRPEYDRIVVFTKKSKQ